jgi:hypothetical protein
MYIIAEGTIPICLIAHIDTVADDDYIGSPALTLYDAEQDILHVTSGCTLDDRLGIYIILNILEAGYRPSIIFTDKEEVGGQGAYSLVNRFPVCPLNIKFMIELDRKGRNDSVYYSCGNKEFEEYINSYGFETAQGTFTDCLILGETWDIAAVNLSCGYMYEHTCLEYAHMEWAEETEKKVIEILKQDYTYMPIYKYEKDEEELFELNQCVLCGRDISKTTNKKMFHGSGYNYYICDKCINDYNIEV